MLSGQVYVRIDDDHRLSSEAAETGYISWRMAIAGISLVWVVQPPAAAAYARATAAKTTRTFIMVTR